MSHSSIEPCTLSSVQAAKLKFKQMPFLLPPAKVQKRLSVSTVAKSAHFRGTTTYSEQSNHSFSVTVRTETHMHKNKPCYHSLLVHTVQFISTVVRILCYMTTASEVMTLWRDRNVCIIIIIIIITK